MARQTFFSFHYVPDGWRASQVRNIGALEGNQPVSDNDWETIVRSGDTAIENWIARQMNGRSCVAVLIGTQTANRKWVQYEIEKGWNDRKGVFGIYIHRLHDRNGQPCAQGPNPFDLPKFDDGRALSSVVKAYDPPFYTSNDVYAYIANNIASWADEAVDIRNRA
jgi:hypothetical protein